MESAPNSNSNKHLEEKMPWTPADVTTAEEMLLIADGLDHEINFGSRMNIASQKMKLGNYNKENKNLHGVIAYVSHKSAEARKNNRANDPLAPPKTSEEKWFSELSIDENMRHSLHPEDEAHIIEALSKSD